MNSENLTPTRQNPLVDNGFTSAAMVNALETTWATIRTNHPEVPEVVMVLAPTKGAELGHFWASRWQTGNDRTPEVVVSAEGLRRPVDQVLKTVLHEAAHGLAHARGIPDTSRGGRYHNKRFRALADEMGLTAEYDPRIGWSPCTLRPETADKYREDLARLTDAMTAFRHPDPGTTKRPPSSVTARCSCQRLFRITQSVFDKGPILCGVCCNPFLGGTP